ncbi:MAG: glycosyltransferase family 4 protein [Caulobacterales bacterium]|nr:glycosyltransferase family 4 protein [Caulobacterales bacterium]
MSHAHDRDRASAVASVPDRAGQFRKLAPAAIRRPIARLVLEARWRWSSAAQPVEPADIQPGPLIVSGFFNEVLGVGRAGRLTADWLETTGLPVVRHDLRPALVHQLHGGLDFPVKAAGGVWLIHANPPEAKAAMLAHQTGGWRGRYRIGYWAWETSEAPADWADAATRFHEIWVPSRFVADAVERTFRQRGKAALAARIGVVPHVLPDLSDIQPDRSRFGIGAQEVAVLAAMDLRSTAARKNPQGAIEAWMLAFPRPEIGRRLMLKLTGGTADPSALERLRTFARERPDVTLLDEDLADREMDRLVASVDIVLSPHRAEGFGLVLAEAMALGKGVVATGFSGNMDFMDATSAALIPFSLTTADDPTGRYGGVWAEPDIGACAEILKALVDDAGRRRALGLAAAKRIEGLRQTWSKDAIRHQTWVRKISLLG